MEENFIDSDCPVTKALSIIGGKWKIIIICRLYGGIKRFGELKRSIPGITTKMLTQQLRELEENNVIHREVFKQVPPKVEYSLTELGLSVKTIILALYEWGSKL
ncbi:MAG: HxlR family transcriptional regulator [Spirochaetes bacterium GWD1_27_9]|nr:MAG: HxlR family transcriptional regulator [Spirochaetes bacterium GWB1_27_13]OHD20385.1 MAG: HxlR family transcriptional regulator [Spirochaetes bacterium GWC1_27_15]OHD29098.1 MAG: HxlR family transcriptional regulator [Spirochaetes bacterium GWD1_27_9]